jgi:hypothetical protein
VSFTLVFAVAVFSLFCGSFQNRHDRNKEEAACSLAAEIRDLVFAC